jgi:regulator of sigma E protease
MLYVIGLFLVVLGYWFAYFIIGSLHVGGHLLAAKLLGVRVSHVGIGYGKSLFSFEKSGTTYSLNRIPLWLTVRLHGAPPPLLSLRKGRISQQDSQPLPTTDDIERDDSRFIDRSLMVQWAVIMAGPLSSLASAWLIAFTFYWANGVERDVVASEGQRVTITGVMDGSPAERAGLRKGDRLISIDGQPVKTNGAVIDTVNRSGGRSLELIIERSKAQQLADSGAVLEPENLALRIVPDKYEAEGGSTEARYKIGTMLEPASVLQGTRRLDVRLAAATATRHCILTFKLLWQIADPSSRVGSSQEDRGVVMIRRVDSPNEFNVFGLIVTWMMSILVPPSIFLCAINVLPFPFFDGWRLVRVTLRKLSR